MGCSLCKKQAQAIEETNETIVTPLFNVDDLNQKRKLAIFLVENDYKMYHSFLSEIKNMDDKEFKNLFEGNTNYKFNNSSPRFKELVKNLKIIMNLLVNGIIRTIIINICYLYGNVILSNN